MSNYSHRGIVSLLIVLSAVLAAGYFQDSDWLLQAKFPAWHPPLAVFALGWAAYYLAVMVVLRHAEGSGREGRTEFALLGGQLVMIVSWSALFFSWHRTGWALAPLTLAAGLAAYGIFRATKHPAASPVWVWIIAGWLVSFWFWAVAVWMINGGIF